MTFQVYDTTLRDGAQREGISYSVVDKLAVARLLDDFGVGFIEGGWPGAMPKDTEFFRRARTELKLRHAVLVAFGATRKAGVAVADDPQVRALLDAETPAVCLVAKSDLRHVERALRTTAGGEPGDGRATPSRTSSREGRRVFLDCEHFFDGFRFDPAYAASVVRTALDAGAERVVLCDTNGGMLPSQIGVGDRRPDRPRRHRRRPARHPLPERHLLRGGQHHRRRRGRRPALPGHRQRLRRAARQRRHLRRRRQPPTQARAARPTGGLPGADGARLARHRRDRQHRPRHPPGLRRGRGLRPQGGAARERDQGGSAALQPRRPAGGRQRHADPGHRDGRPGQHRAQEPRAGDRPGRPSRGAVAGDPPGQGAGGAGLVLRGGGRLVRAAGPLRAAGARAGAAVHAGVVPGAGRAPGGRRGRLRGDGEGPGTAASG